MKAKIMIVAAIKIMYIFFTVIYLSCIIPPYQGGIMINLYAK